MAKKKNIDKNIAITPDDSVKDMSMLRPEDFEMIMDRTTTGDEITVESVSFWRDAGRRLMRNRGAILGMIVIFILAVFAIFGPMDPIVGNNADGSPFTYKSSPRVLDDEGVMITKDRIAFVPPRIPGLEKLGIFDGTSRIQVNSFDFFVGQLPSSNEWQSIKRNKVELQKKLGIPYHPYDISLKRIYDNEDGTDYLVEFQELRTKDIKTLPLAEMVSEFSSYNHDNFKPAEISSIDIGGGVYVDELTVKKDFYEAQNIKNLYFWFGTDKAALDNWVRLAIGMRVSLLIALFSLLIDFSLGITYGTIAGFFAGTWVDNLMMRWAEILGSVPAIVFMFVLISIKDTIKTWLRSIVFWTRMSNATVSFLILVFTMSIVGWIGVARMVRAQVIKLRDQEFVLASRTLGAKNGRIMLKHMFPNIIGQLMVMATFTIPGAIFYEAFLTYLGLGLPQPMSSLGVMVTDGFKYVKTIPSMLLIPATAMSVLILAINLLANGLRDALDPRMR